MKKIRVSRTVIELTIVSIHKRNKKDEGIKTSNDSTCPRIMGGEI